MATYHYQHEADGNTPIYDFTDQKTKGLFLSKVFGMMFICLLVTTVVATGFGYGFQALLRLTAVDDGAGGMILDQNLMSLLIAILAISLIALIVMSFVLPITFARGKHNILVPLMIYVSIMGILLSTFTFVFDAIILVESFAVTALVFGLMALLGYVSKGRLAGLGFVLLGLIIGAGVLSLFNWLMILIGGVSTANVTISWIVSLMVFGFLMLVTLFDVYRIKRIAENGGGQDNNLVLYCAYILYSDFISILIRVIYYIAILRGRR